MMSRYDKIAAYVAANGGSVEGRFTRCTGEDTGLCFTLESSSDGLRYITPDGKSYDNPSNVLAANDDGKYAIAGASGSNTEGGNAANNIIGNYAIYENTLLGNVSLAAIVGIDKTSTKTHKPRKGSYSSSSLFSRNMTKPANTHATVVWGDRVFLNLAESFGKDVVLNDRRFLNVAEFANRYNLATSI